MEFVTHVTEKNAKGTKYSCIFKEFVAHAVRNKQLQLVFMQSMFVSIEGTQLTLSVKPGSYKRQQ